MILKSQLPCVFVDSFEKNEIDLYLKIANTRLEKCLSATSQNLSLDENDLIILIQVFNLMRETFYEKKVMDIYFISRLGFRYLTIITKKGISTDLNQLFVLKSLITEIESRLKILPNIILTNNEVKL